MQSGWPVSEDYDLADVFGLPAARQALEIAATGGHTIKFIGEAGWGAHALARCLPGLLPGDREERVRVVDAAVVADMDGHLLPLDLSDLRQTPESSATVRARVSAVRALQLARQGRLNGELRGAELVRVAKLDRDTWTMVDNAVCVGHLNSRELINALRIARTVADMAARETIWKVDMLMALTFKPRRVRAEDIEAVEDRPPDAELPPAAPRAKARRVGTPRRGKPIAG